LGKIQFVQRRATAKNEKPGENGMTKDLDNRPADDQILLDLGI